MTSKKHIRLISFLMVILLVLSFSGCSGNSTEPTETAETGEVGSAKTDLNIGMQDSFSTIDPHNYSLTTDKTLCYQIYEPLYWVDSENNEIPVLASAYTISDDGLSAVFTMKDDVYFTNGDKLAASDVKFSIERAMNSAYSDLIPLESIECDDEGNTVTLYFLKPIPSLMLDLSEVLIVNQSFVEENQDENGLLGFNTCGTGPYMLGDYTPDASITLTANSDYRDGEASIKTLNFYVIADDSTQATALRSGELDVGPVSAANWETISNDPNLETEEVAVNHVTYLTLNTQSEPFNNKLVRQAVACAINREDIIAMTMEGLATPAYTVATPLMNAYSEIDPQFTYDPEKAKALLSKAGYSDGLDIGEIAAYGSSGLAEVVQQELAEVGITCTIGTYEVNALLTKLTTGDYTMSNVGMTNSFDMSMLNSYYGTENIGGFNFALYSNPDVDALLAEGAVCMDKTQREAIYNDILEIVDEDVPYISLYNKVACYAWTTGLNFTPNSIIQMYYDCSWE